MFLNGHRSLLILLSTLGLAVTSGAITANAVESSPYYGRWTVSEDTPQLSTNGQFYKTIDVAPCGKDFCGVSVATDGACGPTLFRFLTIHSGDNDLVGHGKWGEEKKKLVINYSKPEGATPTVLLGLGEDDLDFTGREGSIPTFEANYAMNGEAHCTTQ